MFMIEGTLIAESLRAGTKLENLKLALVPASWAAAKRAIEQYVLAGISKFVIRPAAPPASLDDFLSDFTRELMPLQT
jgi:hypothetical protein